MNNPPKTGQKVLPSYSIAIRTLGKSGDIFEKELKSIACQDITPQKIVVYIAKGHTKPDYSLGYEEYVEVDKGMVSQRALSYDEIDSEFILLLDDDVQLAPDSAHRLLKAAMENDADCVCSDTFHNHNMSLKAKLYNIFVNMTFPFVSKKWAMRIGADGAMSYNTSPENRFYVTQAGEGPAILVRKQAWLDCDMKSEKWLDTLGFAYADDFLEIFKLYCNGFKCGTLYGSGIIHLDGATSSKTYKLDPKRFFKRSRSIYLNWHRMIMSNSSTKRMSKLICALSFSLRVTILQFSYITASLSMLNPRIAFYHIKGLINGYRFTKSEIYKNLPPFVLKNRK